MSNNRRRSGSCMYDDSNRYLLPSPTVYHIFEWGRPLPCGREISTTNKTIVIYLQHVWLRYRGVGIPESVTKVRELKNRFIYYPNLNLSSLIYVMRVWLETSCLLSIIWKQASMYFIYSNETVTETCWAMWSIKSSVYSTLWTTHDQFYVCNWLINYVKGSKESKIFRQSYSYYCFDITMFVV